MAVSLLGAASLTAYPPNRLPFQWRPDERALLTDFSHVTAIAASPFTVFAATTHGLTVYDRRARRWRLPVTALDGYPTIPVRIALADATDNAVWLGTGDGWARYDADIRQWQSGTVPGGVLDFALDARDQASGIFVRTADGWGFLPRGGVVPVPGRSLPAPDQRIRPVDPRTALDLAPMADAMRALILTDPRLRTHQYTAAARTPDQSDLFFGTNGMGVVRVDAVTGEWEPLPFGLVAPGAGAVALGAGGVWVAAHARVGERRGLTWVTDDLSQVQAIEGTGSLGLQFLHGRRMLARGDALWVATERGVLRHQAGSGRLRMFDLGRGLPSPDILSLAPAPDGVWAGTARGLAVVGDNDSIVRLDAVAQPVLALLAVRDSLWVGSASGLGVLVPGAATAVIPPDVAAQPALRGPIVALVRVRDSLIAATPDQLAWRNPASTVWTALRPRGDLGRITSLAADEGGVWVGGTMGLAFWNIARSTFRTLRVPGDIPGPVRDIAVDATYLWVATDSGLVRFSRAAALDR
ncbi:MAG: hypothetical protein HYS40_04520 [Gemmatimonadetes bacterium]|nr:hypothetical protein [Gemmatimonadota bacterium]